MKKQRRPGKQRKRKDEFVQDEDARAHAQVARDVQVTWQRAQRERNRTQSNDLAVRQTWAKAADQAAQGKKCQTAFES